MASLASPSGINHRSGYWAFDVGLTDHRHIPEIQDAMGGIIPDYACPELSPMR